MIILRQLIIHSRVGVFELAGYPNCLWIISESVVASLENFQGKVAQIVEAVSFSFDDFDLVIDPFQKSGMDGVIAVV